MLPTSAEIAGKTRRPRRFDKRLRGNMAFDSYEPGTRCWLPDAKAGWTGAIVVSKQLLEDGKCRLELRFGEGEATEDPGATFERVITSDPSSEVPLRNPEQLETTEDLVTLSHMNEPAVLHAIRRRYEQLSIYTFSGIVLIATNPFARVDNLYTPEIVQMYSGRQRGELEPHLFSIAEDAYRCMVRDQRSQTIVVSGESGAGKTVSAKYIMRYFASVEDPDHPTKHTDDLTGVKGGGSDELSVVEREILATNPIMEAFGNAKTSRNDNSSRFGKYLEIRFNRRQEICGARIRTYLLERSRIVFHPSTERNYHIFYQLMRGLSPAQASELGLDGGIQSFHYLSQDGSNPDIEGVDDGADFSDTVRALEIVGIDKDTQKGVFQVLAALLHVGNITLKATRSSVLVSTDDPALAKVCELLGLDATALSRWLTKRQIKMRSESILSDLDQKGATTVRDSIAKYVYHALFDWLVERVNRKLLPPDRAHDLFIGVLDIYGFEHFKVNSFEQFCINYANEKLQQEFNQHVFKLEQEEYAAEEIDWTYIDFVDNQPCIALIEAKMGILGLLDEESRLPSGSDEGFIHKLYTTLDGKSSHFRKPRLGQSAFVVAHYAHDVTYETSGFIEKNRDTVPEQVIEVLHQSSNPFLVEVLTAQARVHSEAEAAQAAVANSKSAGAHGSGQEGAQDSKDTKESARASLGPKEGLRPPTRTVVRRPTLGNIFKTSLNELMATINSTNVHYIRCIKPNETKSAWTFDGPMVLSQLRACGVLETIRISSAGFPGRWPYADFAQRYDLLLHSQKRDEADPRVLTHHILEAAGDRAMGQYQLGKSKVFLRAGMLAYLEDRRTKRQHDAAIQIQRRMRGRTGRADYLALLAVVASLQRFGRGALARKRAQHLREIAAAQKLQALGRSRATRKDYLATRKSIVALQTAVRAKWARENAENEAQAQAATTIQTLVRSRQARQLFERQRHALIKVQSMIRRRSAKQQLQALRDDQQSVKHMEEQQYRMENKVVELQNTVSAQRDELRTLQRQLAEAQQALAAATESNAAHVRETTAKHDELQRQNADLVDNHANAIRELDDARSQLDEHVQNRATVEQQLQHAEARAAEFQSENAKLHEQILSLQQMVATAAATSGVVGAGAGRYGQSRSVSGASRNASSASREGRVSRETSSGHIRTDSGTWYGDEMAEAEINRQIETMITETPGAKEELLSRVIRSLDVPTPKSNEKFNMRDVLFPANLINLMLSEMWRLGYVIESEKFIGATLRTIQETVQKASGERTIPVGAFWMSNTQEVYSFLCLAEANIMRTPSLREEMSAEELMQYDQLISLAKRDTESVMFNVYHMMMKEIKKIADKMIVPAIVEEQSIPGFQIEDQPRFLTRMFSTSPQPKMDDLITFLTKIYTSLTAFYLEESYVRQPLVELLNMIGAKAFNDMMMRKNFLTWKRAVQINYNVTRIDEWCKGHGLSVVGLPLERLTQSAKLLQLKKNYEKDVDIIYDICYDLTPAQIQRLIANYKPSDYEPPISAKIHGMVAQRVIEDKDSSTQLLLDVRGYTDSGPFEIVKPRHLEKIEPYVPPSLEVPKLRKLSEATTRYSMLTDKHRQLDDLDDGGNDFADDSNPHSLSDERHPEAPDLGGTP